MRVAIQSVEVNRSVEEAWQFLVDTDQWPRWKTKEVKLPKRIKEGTLYSDLPLPTFLCSNMRRVSRLIKHDHFTTERILPCGSASYLEHRVERLGKRKVRITLDFAVTGPLTYLMYYFGGARCQQVLDARVECILHCLENRAKSD
ncbi:MAG: hypothetical protein S4CHLAM102_14330 [Chlamydiia bacterium]|nr:hypothetical protein [Chlamydiia bacterium]